MGSFVLPAFSQDGGTRGGGTDFAQLPNMNPGGGFNFGGQNQYMNFPSMGTNNIGAPYGGSGTSGMFSGSPGFTSVSTPFGGGYSPGYGVPQAPQQGQFPGQNPTNNPYYNPNNINLAGVGGKLPGGVDTGRTIDPSLTAAENQYLMSMIGQGASPFNLSTILPSSGQMTQPGQLNAPLTSTMQNLQDFLMGKSAGVSGVPGTSGPLSYVLPMWQSEVSAMNQPIQQQLANIKEQFGQQGALGSTEMGTALANYGEQTALGEQNLLGQLTMQALPQYGQQAEQFQNLDQQAIQNMYNEFIRTRPEYSPLLQEQYGMATTYPPMYKPGGGMGSSLLAAAPGLMSDVGTLAGGAMAGMGAAGGGSGVISAILTGLAAL